MAYSYDGILLFPLACSWYIFFFRIWLCCLLLFCILCNCFIFRHFLSHSATDFCTLFSVSKLSYTYRWTMVVQYWWKVHDRSQDNEFGVKAIESSWTNTTRRASVGWQSVVVFSYDAPRFQPSFLIWSRAVLTRVRLFIERGLNACTFHLLNAVSTCVCPVNWTWSTSCVVP